MATGISRTSKSKRAGTPKPRGRTAGAKSVRTLKTVSTRVKAAPAKPASKRAGKKKAPGSPTSATGSLQALERRIKALETTQLQVAQITTLAPDEVQLRMPIPVSIEFNGDDYIATFPETGIGASGDTASEAIWNLRDMIVLSFKCFSGLSESQLGVTPRRQFAILKEFIRD